MNQRIAYILTTYPCASETFIYNEISLLKEKGLDVVMFAARKDTRGRTIEGVEVFYRPYLFSMKALWATLSFLINRPIAFFRMLFSVFRYLLYSVAEGMSLFKNISAVCYFGFIMKELNISHIHGAFMNWPARLGYILSKITDKSFSVAVHARDGYVEGGAIGLKVKDAQFVLCCSQAMESYIKSKVDLKYCSKIHTVYHGVHVLSKNPSLEIPEKPPMLIAIGRFVKKKGFGYLLNAFKDVLKECPGTHLVLVGDGPEHHKMKETVRNLNLENDVIFTGWLNHSEVLDKLSESSLLVVPSIISSDNDRDGIPNVILEAFAARIPVVASNVGGINEAIIDRQTGLLSEPGNVLQLKNAIVRLLKDQSLRDQLVGEAWNKCHDQFNTDTNIEGVYSLFNSLN